MATKKNQWNAIRRILRWATFIFVAAAVVSLALVLPLRWADPPSTAFMLLDDSGRDPPLFEWADWQDIGIAPALAVVASEDQRFAEHFGFDFKSMQDAMRDSGRGERLRGASTITQQLAKNLYLWSGRSYLRKGLEAWFTVLLEACLSKKRILEIYLNIVELGPGVYGVPAASRLYFGRNPSRIADSQAALLAAVLPNPHVLQADRPSDYVRERQRWIVAQMQRLRREQWVLNLD